MTHTAAGNTRSVAAGAPSLNYKLLFVTGRGRLDPAGRKRVYDLVPLFRRAGHDVRVISYDWEWLWRTRVRAANGAPAATALLRLMNATRLAPASLAAHAVGNRARFRSAVSWADAVIVNRTPLDAEWRSCLRQHARLAVYDVDDAVWLRGGAESEMFELAGTVVAGNAYLADHIRTFHSDVVTIPTTARLDLYERASRTSTPDTCVIGWVGSPTTVKYLEMLVEPLAALGRELSVTLEIVGTQGAELPAFRNVQLRVHPGVPYDPVVFVPGFDIGVMPMPDGPWERGKCAAKALEYMAAGVPAVCSAVGENVRVVEHARSGFLVRSDAEWLDLLRRLARDPQLRRAMGEAGRARVREAFSADRAVALWSACLGERLGPRVTATPADSVQPVAGVSAG